MLKDFVHVAGPLGVSHFVIFSASDVATNVRLAKVPRGPTLTFHVKEFSLSSDIASTLRKPVSDQLQFLTSPLIILNNFNNEQIHHKLMATFFQNMFPTINIHTVNLSAMKRCVLFHFNSETEMVEFRHYHIKVTPAGMSRPIKKLIKTQVPDLHKYKDIADFVMRGNVSESEAEDEEAKVTLPQDLPGRGNLKSEQSMVKLTEIGPRMTLQLVKIEEEFCDGSVLYHGLIAKTKKEVKELKRKRAQKKKLKEARRKQQEENVERKRMEREAHRMQSMQGLDRKRQALGSDDEENGSETFGDDGVGDSASDGEDDDTEWYRSEVGEEPDEEFLMTAKKGRKRHQSPADRNGKIPKEDRGGKEHKKRKISGGKKFTKRTKTITKAKRKSSRL